MSVEQQESQLPLGEQLIDMEVYTLAKELTHWKRP